MYHATYTFKGGASQGPKASPIAIPDGRKGEAKKISTPAGIITEILSDLREIHKSHKSMSADIDYCIKNIATGKIYETTIDESKNDKQANGWFDFFNGHKKQLVKLNNMSKKSGTVSEDFDFYTKFGVTDEVKEMLTNIDSLDFHIFNFKAATDENELTTISTFLMHRHGLFTAMKIDYKIFLNFMTRIQDHYNPVGGVEYHNKSHGADVCQTSNYFMNKCKLTAVCDISSFEMGTIFIAGS